jgi:uncharacterized protein (DUF58 family)
MGKRKWRRVLLEDLASEAEQERVLKVMDQAKRQPAPVSPEKQASETPTTGR